MKLARKVFLRSWFVKWSSRNKLDYCSCICITPCLFHYFKALISNHHLVLFWALLLLHFAEAARVESLEATEDEGSVLSRTDLLVDGLERSWHTCVRGWHVASKSVMINVQEHLLVAQSGSLHEGTLELRELVLTCWWGWVKNKDDAVSALLNWAPALFVAPITAHVPELNVDLAENAGWSRCILLVLDDPKGSRVWDFAEI